MFLKSVKVKNYRKFGDEDNCVYFAYQSKSDQEKDKVNVSERTTLFVGKNNSGKTSIIHLLSRLAQSGAQSSGYFSIDDINYGLISKYYNQLLEEGPEDLKTFPSFEVELEIGFKDIKNKRITALKDVLYVREVETIQDIFEEQTSQTKEETQSTTVIKVSFEPRSLVTYQKKAKEFYDFLKSKKITDVWKDFELEELEATTHMTVLEFLKNDNMSLDRKTLYQFTRNYFFKEYLDLLEKSHYVIKVYPSESEVPVEKFDFSKLFSIQLIEANLVTSPTSLTKSYNQILKNMILGEESKTEQFNKSKDSLNYQIYQSFLEVVETVNQSISKIESPRNLKMALEAALDLDVILNHATTYSYEDGEHYIPETQFGLGYTNLMLIIAKLTEYFYLYDEDNLTSKINLIAIEEPESFMHPQMQENFILYIEEAINQLINNPNQEANYQMLISTHSSHVLNSKLHSGNTFNHINYFQNFNAENGVFAQIYPLSDQMISKESSDSFKFVKKHVELEMSDIFFADAVILVEGITEELYLKYLMKEKQPYRDVLGKHHIKVYKINGAHAKVYLNLLDAMKIPSVIITDMDYQRKESQNKTESKSSANEINPYSQISDIVKDLKILQGSSEEKLEITTNATIKTIFNGSNQDLINSIEEQKERDYFKFEVPESNTVIFTQGKINGFYATSFEEALILQNGTGSKKKIWKKY